MPRYLTFVKMDESMPAGPPPPALYEAIGKLGDDATKDGTMVLTGGLYPSSAGALVHLADGKIEVVDGPFAESKELIGGFAMFELRNKEEAVEQARRFLQIHADYWPGCAATVEVRQIADENEAPAWAGEGA
jgi:hypothetical protein